MTALQPIIKFYSAWFCPYAQRTWIALNQLNLKYELIESLKLNKSGEYVKNEDLLLLNSKGLVPTLDINNEVVVESIDTINYLNKHFGSTETPSFVTPELVADAHSVNQTVCSPFYRILVKQHLDEQETAWNEICEGLQKFTEHVTQDGYYKSSSIMNIVDITLFPWAHRLYLLKHYRGKSLSDEESWVINFHAWFNRMLSNKSVVDTLADESELTKIYSRYAEGNAKSKVADAVRSGKEAHDLE